MPERTCQRAQSSTSCGNMARNRTDHVSRVLMVGRSQTLFDEVRRRAGLREEDVETCPGPVEAVRHLGQQTWDVLLTDQGTTIADSLAVAADVSAHHPSVRILALWPAATNQEISAAIRANIVACFTEPFDLVEIADMVRAALSADEWRNGIDVVSGLPHWLTLRVACHLVTADRLVRFMSELQQTTMPEVERDLLIAAFRELLLNAMEHGAGFDAEKMIEVTAAKTERAIVYHFKDPGPGFDSDDLKYAARSRNPDDLVANVLERAAAGRRPGGFGMLIAGHIADELVYNERRNEVLMIKHLS